MDVTFTPREADGDRGQMLLIAAFGLAVTLVVLALILNTVIYTENIATRGSDIVGGKDAAQYRVAARDGGAGIVEGVNYVNNSSSYPHMRAEVADGVAAWNNATGIQQARRAAVTNVSVVTAANGVRIYQSDVGNFTNRTESGEYKTTWRLFNDTAGVVDVRNYTLTVDFSTLATIGGLLASVTDAFYLEFQGASGDLRRVYVYVDSSGDAAVKVRAPGVTYGTCTQTISDDEFNVSITNASLDGKPCPALSFFDALDEPYALSYNQTKTLGSDTIEGTYTLFANNSTALTTTDEFGGFDVAGNPAVTRAVYSVTLRTTYRSPRLTYRTRIRVAPGEPDDA